MQNKLVETISQVGLAEAKSKFLLEKFSGYFQEAQVLAKEAKEIIVTSIEQKEEMNRARELRSKIRDIRTKGVEPTRKELKEQSLREGKAIDGIANVIKALIIPVEEHLEAQEKFAERIEAEKKLKVEAQRVASLSKYVEEAETYSLHPDKMSEETFNKLLENSKIAYDARAKAEKEAEEDRIAKEKAYQEEQKRIREENAKLKAEAEAREKQLAKERAEQQAKLDAERKARFEAEEKIRKEREAQEAKLKAEAEAKRKAGLAPDKEKLQELANRLKTVEMPIVNSPEAKKVIAQVEFKIVEITGYIRNAEL